uniref:ZAD domain-containing protein n=1 Tax=Lepeophtheirus salmonis TaxID=72036 RepID=A0A0K2T316_LEPSM
MVSISGEAFKVCGLCSQLVDTSVDIDEILIDFLSQFLSITPDNFPPKICTDCFSSATEAKRFKEHCIKAIHKIKKTRLCTSVILGKDTVGTSRMISPSRKSEPPPRNSYGILSPRSNNFEKSSLEELQVQIPYTERNEADKKFEEDGCSYLKKKSEKNHSNTSSSISSPSKRQEPNSPSPKSSNSNRKRPSRIIHRTERTTSNYPPPKKKSKGGQGQTPTKARPSSLNSSKDSTELDTAEVFPSIGPYQCEICQKITDTKQEFVQHIKELHRSVVDEEVLESLEQDLKKVERRLQNSQGQDEKVKEEELDSPAEQKNTSLPNNQSTSDGKKPSNNSLSCPRCSAVLSNVYSMKKHQKTKSCRNFVKNTQDINAERFRDDCLESRTCIYCSKVVSRIRDLESHHASKYCSSIRADKEKEFKSKEAVIEKSTNSSSLKENGSLEKRGNTSSISSSNASDYNAKETAATSSSPSQENESMIPSEHEKDDDKISLNNNNNNTQEAKSIETPASDENGSQRSSSKTEGQESTVSDNVDVINS